MKINKPNILAILFVILYISLFFLPSMIDSIPGGRVKFIIAITLNSLVLIYLIFETYKDILNSFLKREGFRKKIK